MTSERTQAYGRIVKTLEEIGPVKLLASEQERIRDAADILIFAEGPDDHVIAALDDVRCSPTTLSSPAAGPRSAPCCSSTTSPAPARSRPVA